MREFVLENRKSLLKMEKDVMKSMDAGSSVLKALLYRLFFPLQSRH